MSIFNFKKNILLEADDETIDVNETDNVDYAEDMEDTPEDTDNTDETTNDDNEEETNEENTDDQGEDNPEEDDSTDYTEDVAGDETTDDTDGQTDDTTSEEQPAEEEPPSPEAVKNATLLRDVVDLYYEIINTINKIDSFIGMNHKVNQVCVQAKNNLTMLNDYIYDFINGPFKTNTYVKNLYVYQYALEILKINIEMFRNIEDFNSM